jgi:primosomal replication protein N''
MIRLCPNCRTERPLTELFCEGTSEGRTCHWDLSGVDISAPGVIGPIPSTPPAGPALRTCPNGHGVGDGDLICSVCEAPVSASPVPPPERAPAPEETIVEGWRLSARLPASSTVCEAFVAVRAADGRQAVLTLYAEGSEPDPYTTRFGSCRAITFPKSSRPAAGATALSR